MSSNMSAESRSGVPGVKRRLRIETVAGLREYACKQTMKTLLTTAMRLPSCFCHAEPGMIRSFAFTTQGRLHTGDIDLFLMPTLLADTIFPLG